VRAKLITYNKGFQAGQITVGFFVRASLILANWNLPLKTALGGIATFFFIVKESANPILCLFYR